jgi:hypothetical protein
MLKYMDKIEKLENRNRFLNNRIAKLSNGKQTEEEQKIIEGDFQEIAINENEIRRLKENNLK